MISDEDQIMMETLYWWGIPTLFRSDSLQKLEENGEKSEDQKRKASSKIGLLQLMNNGNFKEFSNFSTSSLKVRSHGVVLIVPEVVVCVEL